MKKTLWAVVFLLVSGRMAWALDPFKVRDIRVEGIQRIEAGTIFNYLPVKVGDTVTEEKASAAIRTLFATGFFRDVRMEAQGDVLVVIVEERPAVASIEFTGLKEFDKDQIKKGLRDIGIQEGRIFDRAMLEQAEQELKRQYLTRGKYAVSVSTTVNPLERNRVAVNFNITEGEAAKIRRINIVGARAFHEDDLLNVFQLRTPGMFTWLSKNDQYSRQKLQADLEAMRSYYLNRGYMDFNIESTQVSITPDKRDIYITVNIIEGEKYTVTDIKLGGELLLPEDELRKLITMKSGETFSQEKRIESNKAISDRLGHEGYAFANINAVPQVDKDKRTVAFTFLIDPGRRVYVRRINIVGNNRSRDEVIRREMRQLEGAFYDTQKLQLSKQRIDRTGFFSEVEMETPPVAGTTDQVDVTVRVKERPTGSLMAGIGYSTVDKVILQGGIQQSNFFGSGKSVSVQINSGSINKVMSLSVTEPYYTVDGVSRGYDIYRRKMDATRINLGNYKTDTYGAGVRFGVPYTEQDTLLFGVSGEHTQLGLNETSPARYLRFVNQFGANYTALIDSTGWVREGRDSVIWPTRGRLQRTNLELSGGDLEYYKFTYMNQWFYPLSKKHVLMLKGQMGKAGGLNGKPLPFFKSFYLGGVDSVRGYSPASLGPRDADGSMLGGDREVNGTAELLFPMPGSGTDKSMRLGWFYDGGQVFGVDESFSRKQFRYSTGLSFSWNSPMGPMKISVARPIRPQPGDNIQRVQFTLGAIF